MKGQSTVNSLHSIVSTEGRDCGSWFDCGSSAQQPPQKVRPQCTTVWPPALNISPRASKLQCNTMQIEDRAWIHCVGEHSWDRRCHVTNSRINDKSHPHFRSTFDRHLEFGDGCTRHPANCLAHAGQQSLHLESPNLKGGYIRPGYVPHSPRARSQWSVDGVVKHNNFNQWQQSLRLNQERLREAHGLMNVQGQQTVSEYYPGQTLVSVNFAQYASNPKVREMLRGQTRYSRSHRANTAR